MPFGRRLLFASRMILTVSGAVIASVGLVMFGSELLVRLQHGQWVMRPLAALLDHVHPTFASIITVSGWPLAHEAIFSLLKAVPLSPCMVALGATAVTRGAAGRDR